VDCPTLEKHGIKCLATKNDFAVCGSLERLSCVHVWLCFLPRDTVWGVLTGQGSENVSSLVVHEIRELETWILHLLSAPVPVPGKTRVEVGAIKS